MCSRYRVLLSSQLNLRKRQLLHPRPHRCGSAASRLQPVTQDVELQLIGNTLKMVGAGSDDRQIEPDSLLPESWYGFQSRLEGAHSLSPEIGHPAELRLSHFRWILAAPACVIVIWK